jgi:RNA polymerase sigma-70 factor (ECF subfamily)
LLWRIRDAGDAEAWHTFVDIYGRLIYRHARSRGLQDADAAELTQEVLLQVSQAIRQFEYDPQRGRFRDWLGTVTLNKIRRFLHKQAGAVASPGGSAEEDALPEVASPIQDTEWSEAFTRHILQNALARIRSHFEEPTWRAFELVWRDRLAIAEAAQQMNRSADWVYKAKSRVLKRLHDEVLQLAEDMPLLMG